MNRLTFNKEIPIYFFLFTASISVCTITLPSAEYLTIFLSFIMLIPFYRREMIINKYFKYVFLLFVLPIIISTLFTCVRLGFKNDSYYYDYFTDFLPGRLIHLILFAIILNYIHTYINKNNIEKKKLEEILKSYLYGIFIILGIFGIWQILNSLFGIWCPEVQTRGNLYFASDMGINRVTSLADEPSYLVPFIIDGIFIALFLRKRIIPILLLIVLLFSLSFGAYVEIFFLSISYLFLMSRKNRIKIISILFICLIIFIIAFPDIINVVFTIISSREELQSGFEMDDTSRTAMIIYPIKTLLKENFFVFLFGNGPASFKYLETSDNNCIFATSNNILVDLLYEGGLLSFTLIIALFIFIWGLFSKSNTSHYNLTLIKLFLIHVVLSSMYRADYASERFMSILVIIETFYLILNRNTLSESIEYNENISNNTYIQT